MELDEIKIGKVFGSYPLTDFQGCPKLWDLGKRWQPRVADSSALIAAGIVGSAVAKGLEHHYKDSSLTVKECQAIAEADATERYKEGLERSLEGILELVRRGVKHGMATDLGLAEILGVEKNLSKYAKPDLVGRKKNGRLVVVDHKCKMRLEDDYKEKELGKFDTSNQMFMYAWSIYQEYGEMIEEAVIHLIVLAPRVYTELHPIPITKQHVEFWLEGAAKDWQEMEAINARKFPARPRFSNCTGQWGKCKFFDMCHFLLGDESKAELFYDKKQWGF